MDLKSPIHPYLASKYLPARYEWIGNFREIIEVQIKSDLGNSEFCGEQGMQGINKLKL